MMMVEFIKNLQLFTSLNSGIDMKPKEFFDAVVRMREKQQEYFKTKTSSALTACESKQVEEVKASSNQSYPVEKLFTVDGITVYRFRDNDRYVYFTNRTGDVQYSYQKRVGKATENVKVQTMCNNGQENQH